MEPEPEGLPVVMAFAVNFEEENKKLIEEIEEIKWEMVYMYSMIKCDGGRDGGLSREQPLIKMVNVIMEMMMNKFKKIKEENEKLKEINEEIFNLQTGSPLGD